MDASSNLSLPYIAPAQAQKHVTHNEALRALDAIVQLMVLDKDLTSPPGSPSDGARYVVAASPTGAWAGQAGKIAAYQDGAWAFYAPLEGWLAWVADEDKLYVWSGSAWAEFGGGGGGGLDNLVDDTTPQLGGDLDANGHSIGFDTGTGVTDDAGNEQIVFHKTASAINQIGVTNAAAGGAPQIAAEGGDTNIDLTLAGKGTGHPKAALFGVNAPADTTTRFALAAAASLFNHAGAGHQHKINKNAAGDTASLLYQTGFSGRAEMGTTGDDDFHFKVSADGSAWNEAILIDRSTGRVSLPATPYLDLPAASAPATPATGKVRLYAKTDKSFYQKDDAGTETVLAGGGEGSFQPLDSDLTAIAALTTTSFGRALLEVANAAALRTAAGLVIGTDVQAFSAVLSTLAGASANGQSLVTAANYAAMRALLDLEAGTDFLSPSAIAAAYQPLDSDLTAIAALTTTSFGRALLELANAAALRTAAGLVIGTDVQAFSANLPLATLSFIIDGGGSTITTGIKGDLEIPFACTINRVTLLADQSGSIVVDVWKDTYANFPPTNADSITASAKPTISAVTKAQDSTLTGWTTSIAAGDVLRFNVDSVTSIQRCTLSLKVTKT